MLKSTWKRIKTFFKDSETLAFARFQALIGVIATIVTYIDPTILAPYIGDADWFPWLVAMNGFGLEYLRRRRADMFGDEPKPKGD